MEARAQKELSTLISDVSSLKSEPNSLSLSAHIEITFSHMLLHKLLLANMQQGMQPSTALLSFLHDRWRALAGTSALNAYSKNTKINRACKMVAEFYLEHSKDTIFQTIIDFEGVSDKSKNDSLLNNDEKIYRYIFDTFLANQSIDGAFKYISRHNDIDRRDNWRDFLRGVIGYVPDRITFIRIMAIQVERSDWRFFISRMESFDLYSLILRLPVEQLYKAHKQKPENQQGNTEFELELLSAADELLRRKRSMLSYPGDVFKGLIESDHACETKEEVCALAFCLLETYRRVREKLDEYSFKGQLGAFFAQTVCTKQDKIEACDVVMQFILTEETFTHVNLHKYVDTEKKAGKIKQSTYDKFMIASEQGALKMLLDALFEIQRKVDRAVMRPY